VLSAAGPVLVSSLFSCLAVPDDRLSFRPIWAPPWISALRPETRSGLSGAAARHGLVDTVTLEARSDSPASDRALTGTGLIMTTDGDEVLGGLTAPRHPRWWRDTLLVAEGGSGRLLAVDPGGRDAETVVELPGVAGGLAVAESHAVVGYSVAARSGRDDLPGGRVPAGAPPRDGFAVVDLERGVLVGEAQFLGHAGPILSIAAIPAPGAVSIAEPRGAISRSTVVMGEPEPL
jgi:uncharacterized protein (TIGR03032 family)